ncbi:MAG: hypothetical protein RLZZ367_2540 [Bacteroidota bacterium]|jgi:RNA recognition motif-containing protein
MKIYISNLESGINNSDLNTLFSEYGNVVSANVIMDRMTNQSRGFGFIDMPDDAAAKNAISELNEAEYQGRVIRVSEARPPKERQEGGFRNNFNRDNGRGRKSYGNNRY